MPLSMYQKNDKYYQFWAIALLNSHLYISEAFIRKYSEYHLSAFNFLKLKRKRAESKCPHPLLILLFKTIILQIASCSLFHAAVPLSQCRYLLLEPIKPPLTVRHFYVFRPAYQRDHRPQSPTVPMQDLRTAV